MTNWVANKIMEFRIILIILSFIILFISVSGIKFIKFSPDIDNFFPENHSTVVAHNEVEDTFTTTDNLIIAIGAKEGTIFQPRTLDLIEKLKILGVTPKEAYSLAFKSRFNFKVYNVVSIAR